MVIHTCTTIILTWHLKLYIQDLLDFYLPRIELYVKLRQWPSPLLKPPPHIAFLLCRQTELHLVWINELLIPLGQPRHHQRDLPVSSLGKVCSSKQWVYRSPSHPRQACCGKYGNMLLLPRHGHRTTHSTSAPQLLLQCPRDSDTSTSIIGVLPKNSIITEGKKNIMLTSQICLLVTPPPQKRSNPHQIQRIN